MYQLQTKQQCETSRLNVTIMKHLKKSTATEPKLFLKHLINLKNVVTVSDTRGSHGGEDGDDTFLRYVGNQPREGSRIHEVSL
jgi:hypothetical protein